MLNKLVYITGSSRSGSTVLEFLLNNHSRIISVGEVSKLKAYAAEDRRLYNPDHPLQCFCGQAISNCEFWRQVEKSTGKTLQNLELNEYIHNNPKELKHRKKSLISNRRFIAYLWLVLLQDIVRLMAKVLEPLRFKGIRKLLSCHSIAADNMRLYEAIAQASGTEFVVDASKYPYKFKIIHDYFPDKIKVIYLIREPGGVIWSKMKRGREFAGALNSWVIDQKNIWKYLHYLPQQNYLIVHYEDLCRKPERELQRICEFLQIRFEPNMCRLESQDMHHIGGSPSKFDFSGARVKLDNAYLEELSPEQVNEIKARMQELKRDRWSAVIRNYLD